MTILRYGMDVFEDFIHEDLVDIPRSLGPINLTYIDVYKIMVLGATYQGGMLSSLVVATNILVNYVYDYEPDHDDVLSFTDALSRLPDFSYAWRMLNRMIRTDSGFITGSITDPDYIKFDYGNGSFTIEC